MATSLLLRNATVLIHSNDDHVTPRANTDILIKDDLIADIGSKLSASGHTKIIDCTGQIVTPGFVDTHHHLWQTQLKGRHADEQLLEYMVSQGLPAISNCIFPQYIRTTPDFYMSTHLIPSLTHRC
jgi:cytosine/adenosine deaminase-related metal-dependent hydrolase